MTRTKTRYDSDALIYPSTWPFCCHLRGDIEVGIGYTYIYVESAFIENLLVMWEHQKTVSAQIYGRSLSSRVNRTSNTSAIIYIDFLIDWTLRMVALENTKRRSMDMRLATRPWTK